MEEVIKTAVEMTAEEKAQFEAYKAEKAKKEAEARCVEAVHRAEVRQENGEWKNIPLGMTEA